MTIDVFRSGTEFVITIGTPDCLIRTTAILSLDELRAAYANLGDALEAAKVRP